MFGFGEYGGGPTSDVGLVRPSFPNGDRSVHLLTECPNLHLVLAVRD